MRTLALTAALIASTASTAAIGANWVIVAESNSGDVFTVDSTSIRTMPNGYKRAWIMQFYAKLLLGEANRGVILKEFDCREVSYRSIQSTYYKDNEVVSTDTSPSNWSFPHPDSLAEAELNYVCFGKLEE